MKNTLHFLLWLLMICCWSCSSGGDDPIPTPTPKPESNKIEISGSDPVVEQKAGTATITFTTNAAWTASVGTSTLWLSVSPASGTAGTHTLTVTAQENDTYDERNATVTIKAGSVSKNITVTQKQKDALTITSNKVEIGAEGGEFTIEAKTNVSLTYEIEESAKEWISAGESRALTTKALKFNAKANEKDEPRQGIITLKGGDGLTETITIYQEGEKPALVITSNDVIVGSEGETIKIELKSNVDYTMVLPNVDWISQAESRTISAYTHYLNIAPNESYDQRNAMVYFQNEVEELKDSISITQLQLDAIIVAKNEYSVEAEGSQLEFKVSSNVDFKISTSADWIKQNTGSRGLVEKALSFTIQENEAKESRNGEIIITYGELNQTIKVNQQGAPDYEAIERAALIEFYQATGGDNWRCNDNWCSDKPLKEWYGIETNDKNRVIAIELFNLSNPDNLRGYIPESIGNLTALKVLRLHFTQLSGQLPESIGKLTSLENIYLRTIDDQLTGSLPESIGNLTALKELNLCLNNKLSGPIPESIGKLSSLKRIYFFCTQFNGPIPESIGNLSSLEYLYLAANQLTGSIPESIGRLSNLNFLSLDGNQLTGNIPGNLGNLSNLRVLSLGGNKFTGSIPESIGSLSKLKELSLNGNQLTGSIPGSLGNLSNLQSLSIGWNQLVGSIPESIGNLAKLEYLDLCENQFSGSIPESIGKLSNLKTLFLNDNQLTGSIPGSIGNLTTLEWLYLNDNQLTGSIPSNIGNLTTLTRLMLCNNQLTGSIPESLGNLTNLEGMNLQYNSLSGKIPESFTKLDVWKDCWQAVIIGNPELDLEGVYLPAPDFSVIDIQGNHIVSENEYNKNKLTILYQWGTWCPYSHAFNSTMLQLYNTYQKYGMEIIGSCALLNSPTAVEETMSYLEKNPIPWRNIIESADNQIDVFHVVNDVPAVIAVNGNKEIIFQSLTEDYNELANVVHEYFGIYTDNIYTSTDYSRDGEVVTLQKATQGQGINLTFMGEAFVDKDMETGGLYEQKMKEGMEKFFSMEPYKSLRNRFNVYAVKVVSPNAEWTENAEHRINLHNEVCFEYAQKVPNTDKQRPMVSVIYNTGYEVDRSYTAMYTDGSFVGYMMDGISNVLIHESGGHGFANLLDEYVEQGNENSTLSQDEATLLDNMWSTYSWGANVDWRSDATTVKWAHFLKDSRYANEGLGLYEGAYLYGHGAYRPTENSMMRYNDSPFNAPSREQIYKRVMQLSEGKDWKYDYEEFVKFDAKSRNAASRSAIQSLTKAEQQEYIKNHRPPTIIKGTWRDAMKGKGKVVVPLR